MISLLLACVYLGLATGQGAEGTVAQITGGFGKIMAEVGLLIGFGVLIGALLHSMGTFNDLVEILARRVGRRLPYAMTATLAVIFPRSMSMCRSCWPRRWPRNRRLPSTAGSGSPGWQGR